MADLRASSLAHVFYFIRHKHFRGRVFDILVVVVNGKKKTTTGEGLQTCVPICENEPIPPKNARPSAFFLSTKHLGSMPDGRTPAASARSRGSPATRSPVEAFPTLRNDQS